MISWRSLVSEDVDVALKTVVAVDLDLQAGELKDIFMEKVVHDLGSRL